VGCKEVAIFSSLGLSSRSGLNVAPTLANVEFSGGLAWLLVQVGPQAAKLNGFDGPHLYFQS
jgi:hypothetical protein